MDTKKTDQMKTRILEAAFTCFLQYGYTKTRFTDIVKKAGISRASIYLYFRNKEELFITMNRELHEEYLVKSDAVCKSGLATEEKILKIIDIWIINHYRKMKKTTFANELLDGLVNISRQTENRFRELFIESIAPLTGEDMAEIIVFSIRGLMDDRPEVKTLQKRIRLLVEAII
jgi:AcrR family transcriptional regulator